MITYTVYTTTDQFSKVNINRKYRFICNNIIQQFINVNCHCKKKVNWIISNKTTILKSTQNKVQITLNVTLFQQKNM